MAQRQLPIEEISFDPAQGDVCKQLSARFSPRQYRLDVRHAPLIETKISHDSTNNRWVLMLLFQHMALDHEGLETIGGEIAAFLKTEHDSLPTPAPYRDYVAKAHLGRDEQAEERFFTDMLGDIDEPTLPFGVSDVQGDGRDIDEAIIPLKTELGTHLRSQARRLGVSPASVFHLAFARVLADLCGRDDVVFGTVLLGRQGGVAEHTLGMFINTLPLRLTLGGQSVGSAIVETQHRLAGVLVHEHAPLTLAQRCSQVSAPQPLFSALLNYRHNAIADTKHASTFSGMTGLKSEERTNYPLSVSVDDNGPQGFSLTVQAIQPIDASRVAAYLHVALNSLVDALDTAPDQTVMTLQILPEAEQQLLVKEWNTTELDYPTEQCVHELVETQARQHPNAIAVVHGDVSISYHELNHQANRLAHYLLSLGITANDRVAICASRSIETVVGFLGVLKAGGAYVPLDPTYPRERLAYMLEDSAPVALLTDTDPLVELGHSTLPVITLDAMAQWRQGPAHSPKPENLSSRNLAYVIYTSGSTGKPKGVLAEHRATVNRLYAQRDIAPIRPEDICCQKTSISFVDSIVETFAPLIHGVPLHVIDNQDARDPHRMLEHIQAQGVTRLITVPSLAAAMLDVAETSQLNSIRTWTLSGEVLPKTLLTQFQDRLPDCQIHNIYGSSEIAADATAFSINLNKALEYDLTPIGRPIANTQIYLLNSLGSPVPLGAIGEIYVGGDGVARAYLNQPELTAEYFIEDPFSNIPEARMYKTGDLARYLPDGNIEYLGRSDYQIKIRGFRVELGEIEALLKAHHQVSSAVLTRSDNNGHFTSDSHRVLVAYYTGEACAEELRNYLQNSLPDYMVPAAYVLLDKLPLTPSGKLDRNALPNPTKDAFIRAEFEAPVGPIEQSIARIWCELLGIDQVSRHDNFFALGGHSLLAVRMVERLRHADLEADMNSLFIKPSLKQLAESTTTTTVANTDCEELEI